MSELPFTAVLERMNRFQEPEARRIVADLALPPGSRGLDVGCGVGLWTQWLAEAVGPAGEVLGIEPDAERVAHARSLAGARLAPPRLAFRAGDGTALDVPAASVDWVWCGDTLHHILDTGGALREFSRVLRPGGRVVVKESQAVPAVFLPGHPDLERAIQAAEVRRSLPEAGGRSFQERRQRTAESLVAAGLADVSVRTYVLERRAPLGPADREYVERVVFARNWGARLKDLLTAEEWDRRSALCEPGSPDFALARLDYYCVYPITVFTARIRP